MKSDLIRMDGWKGPQIMERSYKLQVPKLSRSPWILAASDSGIDGGPRAWKQRHLVCFVGRRTWRAKDLWVDARIESGWIGGAWMTGRDQIAEHSSWGIREIMILRYR